ncbi:SGNH/GDSL hydrolase family protein [Rhizobium mesosinicum]|uniref:SGNH/GDSL hydrolase family protein n=1 Tax=Rhizobium mesosinicum TaxID=335017 RepID=A0ABS7GVS2_9HYPH|nr:SGNH/GDSL hydrolase family protein [Rhizobium mesosinicum]MBW9053470.1 SGNH/GDSL hydrolase family protein [Rhizobium mesosinicum]
MGAPVVKSTNGYGLPVTVVASGGLPMEVAGNGYGTPIIEVAQGGLPVTYVGAAEPIPPPALPLSSPKVMGFGHSFVLNGIQYLYNASNTATNGASGVLTSGRGVLSLVEGLDGGRYNLDIFAEFSNIPPGFSIAGGQGYGGRQIARGGAGLKIWGAGITIDLNTVVDYLFARAPDIVVIDIGINDLIYAFTNGGTIEDVCSLYAAIVRRIRDRGIWCVLMTVTWSDTTAFPASNPTCVAWKQQLNDLILSLDGESGIRVCNTLSIDGQATSIGSNPSNFFDTNLHPSDKLNIRRAEVLIPILQSMTTVIERRSLDELTGNLLPNPGLTGITGTKTGTATTGDVATGMSFAGPNTGGTSSVVLSKEVISGSSEKQVISITNGAPGGTTSTAQLRVSTAATLAGLGLVAGDRLRWYASIELDDWAGWDFDGQADGPVKIQLPLNNGSTLVYQGSNAASVRNRTLILTGILEIPQGLTVDGLRWNSTFITIRWNTNVAGTGVAKISKLKVVKMGENPRAPWNL